MYNLNEFKAWLTTQSPEKQRNFPPHYFDYYQTSSTIWKQNCQIKIFAGSVGANAERVVLEWMDEVDKRERERETK